MNEPKLQLEAGKFYRTRGGAKAIVFGRNPGDFNALMRPNIGVVDGVGVVAWDDRGVAIDSSRSLVAEWIEPKRIRGWVAFDAKSRFGDIADSPADAVDSFKTYFEQIGEEPTVCIEIDVLEGQGLEGEAR